MSYHILIYREKVIELTPAISGTGVLFGPMRSYRETSALALTGSLLPTSLP